MKRTIIALAACGLLAAGVASAETQTYFGFHIGITNAPEAPEIVFKKEPRVVLIASADVYVVQGHDYDSDIFRSGKYWYACHDGYWYRAKSHRGPFVVIDARKVPRAIFGVPSKHWAHHPHGGPPGLAKKAKSHTHASKHGKSHKHAKGHGKAKGKVAKGD